MAKSVLTNVRLFAAGYDLTGASNKLDWSSEVEEQDSTCWPVVDGQQLWKEIQGGLASTVVKGSGYWEAGTGLVDDALDAGRGVVGPLTACPAGAADGSLAYVTAGMQGSYTLGGAVGDTVPWEGEWKGSWPMARGMVLHPPGTSRSASGTGTGRQLGALTAAQHLYVCVHVLSVSGSLSITPRVESDDNAGFTSATTQATGTAVTSATGTPGQTLLVAGAVTDSYWRAAWACSGTGSALLVVAAGISV